MQELHENIDISIENLPLIRLTWSEMMLCKYSL